MDLRINIYFGRSTAFFDSFLNRVVLTMFTRPIHISLAWICLILIFLYLFGSKFNYSSPEGIDYVLLRSMSKVFWFRTGTKSHGRSKWIH
ncbi:hypothetical protein BDV26DRAFT_263152 [Aspergillus bertholletiae]|uniref:Uncharacterized protein n=1 Tax=Aspergillus bertholletiae TaxID=1226010 RepID=A0A5N7B6B3_9EURO|nr:hypothetical protein BDV26DRAFT_263152 [Aspergillus bertholletiae]